MRVLERIHDPLRHNPRRPTGERRAPHRFVATAGLLLVSILLIAACGKVPMPEQDDSLPDLNWHVIDGMSGALIPTTSGDTEGKSIGMVPDMVVVTLRAEDSEGVKRIKLSEPTMTYTCVPVSGARGLPDNGDGEVPAGYQEVIPAPDGEARVYDHLVLVDTSYFTHDCGPDMTLIEAKASFSAEAENFFGGITTSTLELTHIP